MRDLSSMSPADKYQYRVKLYRDAISWRKPDRIGLCANMYNWMYLDQGVSYGEAVRDLAKNREVLMRFVETYNVDQVNVMSLAHRNPFIVSDALGGSNGYTDNDAENLNVLDRCIVEDDEYDELIHNYPAFSWKMFFRRFPKAASMSPEEIVNAIRLNNEFFGDKAKTAMVLREKYGLIAETEYYYFMCAWEDLFQLYRGIRNASIDLRRRKAQVEEYVSQTTAAYMAAFDAWLENAPEGPNPNEPYDIGTGILGHTVLNAKQFEHLYFPMLDHAFTKAAEKGKQVMVYSEGSWERFGELFNQYPKGTIIMQVEQDDIFELRKKFPNLCLMGGISSSVLGSGTPAQNVEMVRRVIDELGTEGGLILQPSKMTSYAIDCKRENLLAICDFVTSYEI